MRFKNGCLKKWLFGLLFAIMSISFAGCSAMPQDMSALIEEQKVDEAKEKAKEKGEEVEGGINHFTKVSIPEFWYQTCSVLKRWAPVFIVGSILLGILLIEVFRKNKEIQKFAWTVLIFKVPLITFIFVYVYAFLYGVFNG